MNEILKKRIEEAARDIAELCPDCDLHCKGKNPCIPKILYQKLIEISTFALQNQWISVDEALPEFEGNFSEYCIIRTENGFCAVTTYYRTSTKEYWWNFEKVKVTHWMPIPELPKGGEE